MKKSVLAMVIILAFNLTGCNNLNNVSDQNYNAMADYMASMILKYDRTYEEKLINPAIIAKASSVAEENLNLNVGETKEGTEVSSDQTSATDVTDKTENVNRSTEVKEDDNKVEKFYDLTELLELKNLDIQYKNYKLYDSFPEEKDDEYFNLEAGKNNKLCVVQFNIKNKTTKNQKFNLLNKEIEYQLDVDSNTYTPLLTLLINDLQFIDISINGEKSEIGYLVFEVPNDIKLDNGNLLVSKDSLKSSIALK